MVTVEEQLSGQQAQVSEAEQNIAEQRKQLNEQEAQVQSISTPQRDIGFQFAVIKNNPKIAGRVEQTIYERQRIKQEGLSQIQTARQNISEYEQNILFPAKAQLSSAQLEMSEWKQAEALAGTEYGGLASQNNPSLHAKVLQIESGNKASFESAKQFSVLKSQGLEPVFGNVAGGITGYTDVQTGKSIPLENLGTYISTNKSTSIPILMSAGLFQMKESPQVTVTDINAQLMGGVTSFALVEGNAKANMTTKTIPTEVSAFNKSTPLSTNTVFTTANIPTNQKSPNLINQSITEDVNKPYGFFGMVREKVEYGLDVGLKYVTPTLQGNFTEEGTKIVNIVNENGTIVGSALEPVGQVPAEQSNIFKGVPKLIVGGFFRGLELTEKYVRTGLLGQGSEIQKAQFESLSTEQRVKDIANIAGTLMIAKGGYDFATKPLVRTEAINIESTLTQSQKTPKISPNLRRDVLINEEGNKVVTDTFAVTAKDDSLIAGQRTIVTNRFRETLGMKPIYSGVPYADELGYAKALKILKPLDESQEVLKDLSGGMLYGGRLTESQAKGVLRYRQPVETIYQTSGKMNLVYNDLEKKPTITADLTMIGKTESRVLDEGLGIATRKKKTTVDFINSIGQELGEKKGVAIYRFNTISERAFMSEQGGIYTPLKSQGKTKTTYEQLSAVKFEKGLKVNMPLKGSSESLSMTREVPIDIYKEQTFLKQVNPVKRTVSETRGKIAVFTSEKEPLTITRDLREEFGIRANKIPTYRKQTPTKQPEMTQDYLKGLTNDLNKIYGKPSSSEMAQARLEYNPPKSIPVITKPLTRKTSVVPSETSSFRPIEELKLGQRESTILKPRTGVRENVKVSSISAQVIRLDEKQKSLLDTRTIVKESPALRENTMQRSGQAFRQAEILRETPRLELVSRTAIKNPPRFPETSRVPIITNTPLFYLGGKKRGKQKKRKGVKSSFSQGLTYEPSLGSSIFNIKLKGKVPTSGVANVGVRRGTLGISQLRRINQGLNPFKKSKKKRLL